MEAIVLAGGLGTRLRTVVADRPKPMADIKGKPFLEYLLEGWIEKGISHFILCIGYQGNFIENHFGNCWKGIAISYSKEEKLLGTGGGLKKATDKLKSDDPFLLLNGDTYFFPIIPKLKGKMTMTLRAVENGERYGTVVLDVNGKISSFIEKKTGKGLINGGVYLIHPSLLEKIPSNVPLSLEKDLLPNWIGELYGVESTANFIDIGIPSDYLVFKNQVEIWQKQKS